MYLFTVILIMPDYIGQYGEDYYLAHVKAESPTDAIIQARKEAADYVATNNDGLVLNEVEDLGLVSVFHGYQVPIDHAHGAH